MPWDKALKALTSTPAQVFGMEPYGELKVGAPANLVVWSGDPFENSSQVEHLLIGGVEQSLDSRQTELRDRYRELPASPAPPLDLP